MTGPNEPPQHQPGPYEPGQYQPPQYQPGPYQPGPYQPGQYQPGEPTYQAYPPPGYGPGAPGGEPYPGAAAGFPPPPGWTLPPEPKRRHPAWIWAVVAAVGVAAVVLAVVFTTGGSDHKKSAAASASAGSAAAGTTGRTLTLPNSVGDYQRITSIDPRQLVEQFRGQLSALGDASLVDKALIGVYGKNSNPQLIFLALSVKDVPRLKDQIDRDGVGAAVKQFVGGIATGVQGAGGKVTTPIRAVDPGPLGGSMQCGAVELMTRQAGVCAWGDKSAFSFNLMLNPTDTATTAEVVRQLRAAAEH